MTILTSMWALIRPSGNIIYLLVGRNLELQKNGFTQDYL